MSLPRKRPPLEPTLLPPLDSLDATDWSMYCDLLQDADAPEAEWVRAGRIAKSLATDTRLVIVSYCPASALERHWLRVGKTWFIGADGTNIESNRLTWWRPAWIRDGFKRYPYDRERYPRRLVTKLLELNHGTPWAMPHPHWPLVLKKRRGLARAIDAFFEGHSHLEIPEEYL